MTIFITTSLSSSPDSLAPRQTGHLRIGLTTDQSPSEQAQIQYQILTPGVVFAGTSGSTMSDSAQVFSTGSTASTPYSLSGGTGLVNIRASVMPASPPATSATAVALTSALAAAAPSAAAMRGAAPAAPQATKVGKKKAAPRKKKVAKLKKAAPKKAKKPAARTKTVAKKTRKTREKSSKRR